ncbi:AfsR/SARP family transcriptional regulator [Nocardia tengchongensis]|uniref:AfsR/SARP family transcriptional regulator n=1 Tax=Nocardia tengchongensis TaxID=2055889 RepID=UPI00368D130D
MLLLNRNRYVGMSTLVDALWEVAPPSAVGQVRNHIARLRKTLEPHRSAGGPSTVVVSGGGGYMMRLPMGCLDLDFFLDLAAEGDRLRDTGDLVRARATYTDALTQWQDPETPALVGVPGVFVQRQRERLQERRLNVLERRSEIDVELGDSEAAVVELRALAAAYPLRERIHELLMTALWRSGRRVDALGVFSTLRRALVDDLGLEPSSEIAALHQRILCGDEDGWVPRDSGVGDGTRSTATVGVRTDPVPLVTPAQLPADIEDFTGRDELVDSLVGQLSISDPETVVISVVNGMGGVGKSTVAVHVAHRVRDRFPDGQLHVDLRGMSSEPALPADVLGTFLRAFGVSEGDLPPTLDTRSALLRSVLANRRVLLMLDNAHAVEQVAPLIPGTQGSAVLITSRAVLATLSGAKLTRLDVMSPEEGLILLTKIVGQRRVDSELDAARDVVESCGFLPLAVRIVGAQLASRPRWSFASIAERLTDTRSRLEVLRTGELTVEAAFHLGYRHLDRNQAHAFRLLARTGTSEVSVEVAAAILEMPTPKVERICESLVDLSLLESAVPGRYRYHDLLRLFAQQQPDRSKDEIVTHVLDFYLATLENLVAVVNPGTCLLATLRSTSSQGIVFTDTRACYRWLTTERSNLVSLFPEAATVGGAALDITADIAWTLGTLMDMGAHAAEMVRALAPPLAAAEAAGNKPAVARFHTAIGALYVLGLGKIRLGRRYLVDVDACGEERLQLWADEMAAWSDILLGEPALALSKYDSAADRARRLGATWEEYVAHVGAANALVATSDFARAADRAGVALRLVRHLGGAAPEEFALSEAAAAALGLGRIDQAMSLSATAVARADAGGIQMRIGSVKARLATACLVAERYADAERIAGEAIRALTLGGDVFHRHLVMLVQSHAMRALGREQEAEVVCDAAVSRLTELEFPVSDLLGKTWNQPSASAGFGLVLRR